MKYLSLKLLAIMMILFSSFILYGQVPEFNPPEKIAKKCNDFIRLKVNNDTVNSYIYMYFEKAERIVVPQSDTVTIIKDYYNCSTIDTIWETESFYFNFKKVYLLDQYGDLMYPKAFENIKFKIPGVIAADIYDES